MEQGEKVGLYSILVNLLLVAMKAFLSLLSGSVALVADAIRVLLDASLDFEVLDNKEVLD